MSNQEGAFLHNIGSLLQQDYRGVNIAVYALSTAGLAIAVHRIRPVSKFSKASKVPDHFIKNHEPLKGSYAGVHHSPVRVLINHQAPIYLPLWHSSKPPLHVKIWGIELANSNAINWLECVARGKQITLTPMNREKEDLVSTVLLHLPQDKKKAVETLDIGQKLVELGFAKTCLPANIKKKTLESKLSSALLCAEAKAKSYRNGIWSDVLPPIPIYIVYWRKSSQWTIDLILLSLRKTFVIATIASKSAFNGMKKLTKLPFKANPKEIQAT